MDAIFKRVGGGGCVPSIETVEIIRQKMYVALNLPSWPQN